MRIEPVLSKQHKNAILKLPHYKERCKGKNKRKALLPGVFGHLLRHSYFAHRVYQALSYDMAKFELIFQVTDGAIECFLLLLILSPF